MSILFGILLYFVIVAWFCALTGINRLDDSEPQPRRASERKLAKAAGAASQPAPASRAHG
jgi:hypothetical protein